MYARIKIADIPVFISKSDKHNKSSKVLFVFFIHVESISLLLDFKILMHPWMQYLEKNGSFSRTRQIIRYRETATLRRPQIKQNTASKEQGTFCNKSLNIDIAY